jgi:GT2 family glycosyltransferase
MRKEAVLDTGELFEGYYYHYDDSDYTARIKNQGWRLELVPAARAWKQPGQRSTYLEVRNRLGFVNRTAGRRIMARELVRSLYHLVRNTIRPPQGVSRSFEARSRLLGIVDFLRGRWGAPPKALRGRGAGRYG